ncbi:MULTISPECIES: DMT family transporter [Brevibacillus]|uniref:DMT family transporter n=1 Tax=Brevibacillus TaxID=55080 RepID=UPI000271A20B|nr:MULTISPECIES: multidrug efflux SMR transporter [Brevibacillus]EJL43404.1 cation/cationic drug transporter [Brevibacillus sp. CF112]MED1824641.1 multidrug efflux SMR transporter [Brevibacillus agri]
MSWVYLLLAILLEVAGTTSMKLSEGLSRPIPTVLMFVFYVLCFSSLSLALKEMEVGTAYAIWSGLGTAMIAVIGVIVFKDAFTVKKVVAVALIIVGCVLLNLSDGAHAQQPAKAQQDAGMTAE